MDVRQVCRNRLCVNPDHLKAVPRATARTGSGIGTPSSPIVKFAAEFGVQRTYLSRIVLGKAWCHLKQPYDGELGTREHIDRRLNLGRAHERGLLAVCDRLLYQSA
jgi:hypothetical protein